jgi:hypothetical protein
MKEKTEVILARGQAPFTVVINSPPSPATAAQGSSQSNMSSIMRGSQSKGSVWRRAGKIHLISLCAKSEWVRQARGVSGQRGRVCAVHGARGFLSASRARTHGRYGARILSANAYSTPSRIPPRAGGWLVGWTVPQIERYECTAARVVA